MKNINTNKSKKNTKQKRVEFRLDDELFNDLELKAKNLNLSVSAYIRETLKNSNINQVNNLKSVNNLNNLTNPDFKLLATQVRKVGVNINEIAYVLNIANKKELLDDYSFKELLFNLKTQEQTLLDILFKKSA